MASDRPVVLTAGYGNLGFAGFIERLKGLGVTHFVDVRSIPESSYWEDFRRRNLEFLVPDTGLEYVYMGDTLGGVAGSATLCKEPGEVPVGPLAETATFRTGIERLVKAASRLDRRIALVCGCLRPYRCHRARLIAPAALDAGLDVRHVMADGSVATHAEIADDVVVQGKLF